jgi:hypothetical protein
MQGATGTKHLFSDGQPPLANGTGTGSNEVEQTGKKRRHGELGIRR